MSGVRVKPLEWRDCHHCDGWYTAEGLGAEYDVGQDTGGFFFFDQVTEKEQDGFETIEAAKAAAQADYEARILAAIEPPLVRTCAKCGAPEDNHPYRHMFVPNVDGAKP